MNGEHPDKQAPAIKDDPRTCGACGREIPPGGSIYCGTEHRPQSKCRRVDPMMRCDEVDPAACCQSSPSMICECECHDRS